MQKGDVVAYLGHNCHRLLEAYYGVLQTGAILLPLNVRLTANDFRYILDHSEAQVLLFSNPSSFQPSTRFESNCSAKCSSSCSMRAASEPWLSDRNYEEHPGTLPAPEAFPSAIEDENDVAELFYTSGTTAQPKGVMLTHRNLFLHAMSVMWALTDRRL